MKSKCIVLFSCSIILLLLCSCAVKTKSITCEEAVKLVQEKVQSGNQFVVDGEKSLNGTDFIVVREYASTNPEASGMAFTVNWYYVETNTGKVFRYDVLSKSDSDNLILLN